MDSRTSPCCGSRGRVARSARSSGSARSGSASSATGSSVTAGSSPRTPLVREPPPARDRPRDRGAAAAPPPRRAGGRHEPGRDPRDHRADRAAPRRGRLHDPRHRARHALVEGISDRVVALDHGVKIAEGTFDAGRDRSASGRGVPRARGGVRRETRSERGPRSRSSGWSGDQHLLRPDAHPPGRGPRGGAGRARVPLGGNASGKSTTLKTILGRIAAQRPGRVRRRGLTRTIRPRAGSSAASRSCPRTAACSGR